MSKKSTVKMTTPEGFIYFPVLIKPFPINQLTNKPHEHYNLQFMMEPGTDDMEMRKAILRVAEEFWPDGVVDKRPERPTTGQTFTVRDALKQRVIHQPILNHNLEAAGYPEGSNYIRVKSKMEPVIVDSQKEVISASMIQPGNRAKLNVSIFAYANGSNQGVTIWLNAIQRLGEGKPIGVGGIDGFEIETRELEEEGII